MTWLARFCCLVSILFLRTADAFRAIERLMHGAAHRVFLHLVVDAGIRPEIARHIYKLDSLTRAVCAPATVVAYRWCNWWRHRGLIRQEMGAEQPSNVKGIGAWSAQQKQQR